MMALAICFQKVPSKEWTLQYGFLHCIKQAASRLRIGVEVVKCVFLLFNEDQTIA